MVFHENATETIFRAAQDYFTRLLAGETRVVEPTEEEPVPDELVGPIMEELIRRGYYPSDFLAQPETDQIDMIENTPPRVIRNLDAVSDRVMTDYTTFISIGLDQCGSDRETFSQLAEVWNREKDDIQQMTPDEVRRNLTCP